jgi:divalent metal cation (Fe/Co/Zn/Cd) transporter
MIESFLFSPRFHCIFSAYVSIAIGITITVLSFSSAWSEHRMSMYAMALLALIDTVGSVLVVYFYSQQPATSEHALKSSSYSYSYHRMGDGLLDVSNDEVASEAVPHLQEQQFTLAIGVLMVVMSALLVVHSAKSLLDGSVASENTWKSLMISVGGVLGGIGLALYKYFVAKAAHSSIVMAGTVIIAQTRVYLFHSLCVSLTHIHMLTNCCRGYRIDAISSFSTGLASVVSVFVLFLPDSMWWFDGSAGLVIALYTLSSGAVTIYNSNVNPLTLIMYRAYQFVVCRQAFSQSKKHNTFAILR